MNHQLKTVILPREHGSWGLTFEPLTLALIIAASLPGAVLFLGAAAAFFAHTPARQLLSRDKKNRYALPFFLLYGGMAGLLMGIFIFSVGWPLYAPLLLALIIMSGYLLLEYVSLGRKLYTEIIASVAIGLMALSIVLAGGWLWPRAVAFLILLYLRSIATTLYVHHRLLLEKKQLSKVGRAMLWQVISLLLAMALWLNGNIPFLALMAVLILGARALGGLSSKRKKATVRKIGMLEFAYGVQFVILSAIGYWNGW